MSSTKRITGIGLSCSLLAAVACASIPPPREIVARADDDVMRAKQERAATYAPVPLRKAEEKLELSKQAMAKRENIDAKRYAEQASADADVAIASADKAKTEQIAKELGDTIQALGKEVHK